MRAGPLCCAIFAFATIAPAFAAIRFENFASTEGLSFVGNATVSRAAALRLTASKHDQSGAVWLLEKQRVASGFETTFSFQLTHQGGLGHGADGFAFVLQNAGPEALGGRGSAGGFAVTDPDFRKKEAAIPYSIAVFFDTYRNQDEQDPSANYLSFRTYGRPSDQRWPSPRLASTTGLPIELKDRRPHTVRIRFAPPVLSVFLDEAAAPVLEAEVDLSIVLDPQGSAWVGFTASTGGGYENHDILNWSFGAASVSSNMSVVSSDVSFAMSACLPDRNLCTPEQAFVAPAAAGYHIVLPANLEWGAAIPNAKGRAVVVSNAHGIVCWNFKAQGSEGCSGPSGSGAPAAGPGFLSADAPAGALIMRTAGGHTWFSVNGRTGAAFKQNEGFYEFDLEIK